MTKNQIEYQKLQELKRSNLAQEALTGSRDRASREAKLVELDETQRHNRRVEDESQRHNQAVENQARVELGIKQQDADTRAQSQAETARSNMAREAETQRSNLATESETRRHNVASEREAQRSNVARETENTRHNTVVEGLEARGVANTEKNDQVRRELWSTQTATEAERVPLIQAQTVTERVKDDKLNSEVALNTVRTINEPANTAVKFIDAIVPF